MANPNLNPNPDGPTQQSAHQATVTGPLGHPTPPVWADSGATPLLTERKDRWLWLRLTRAPWIALSPRVLILGMVGLILLRAGWFAIDLACGSGTSLFLESSWSPLALPTFSLEPGRVGESLQSAGVTAWVLAAEPIRVMTLPILRLFAKPTDFLTFLHAFLGALWMLWVWSVFGGAIGRIAVVDAARSDRIGMIAGLRFALARGFRLGIAPCIPLMAAILFLAPLIAAGLITRIHQPWVQYALALAMGPLLLCGLIFSLIVVGMLLSWPFMVLTIVTEDEDHLEALSRGYHYVMYRLGHCAFYAAVAAVLGLFVILLPSALLAVTQHNTNWGITLGNANAAMMLSQSQMSPQSATDVIHKAWFDALQVLIVAAPYGYFWTVVSIMYLLLRNDLDGVLWSEVEMTADVSTPATDEAHNFAGAAPAPSPAPVAKPGEPTPPEQLPPPPPPPPTTHPTHPTNADQAHGAEAEPGGG